jgi:hypothetical protein
MVRLFHEAVDMVTMLDNDGDPVSVDGAGRHAERDR